ncbi:MAG: sodium:calcium antiporter [Halanaerobiales bacterium]
MQTLWLEFLSMAILVIISGIYLSKYGDIIADKTGLGQALIGGILIALATSLPELVTSITSVLVEAPNIAIGNVFGSNIFNFMIVAIADILHGNTGPLMLQVRYSHLLSGLVGILLSAVVCFSIVIYNFTDLSFGIFNIGLDSILVVLVYLMGVRLIFRYENKNLLDKKEENKDKKEQRVTLKKANIIFTICAIIIIFAGSRLSITGDKIATVTGIDKSFVGSIMVAAVTSLPELVTIISAIRIDAYNMAIGNVMGSNIFNMIIIFFADIFYKPGYIMGSVSQIHIITAMVGIIMSTIALIGIFYRSKKTFLTIGWDSLSIAIVYVIGVYLLFILGINV